MVRGDLSGAIIKDEGIEREYINLLVHNDLSDGKIIGGFHTSGWHIGGKKTMVMSGIDMKLEKVSEEQVDFSAAFPNGMKIDFLGILNLTPDGIKTWHPNGELTEIAGVLESDIENRGKVAVYRTTGENVGFSIDSVLHKGQKTKHLGGSKTHIKSENIWLSALPYPDNYRFGK